MLSKSFLALVLVALVSTTAFATAPWFCPPDLVGGIEGWTLNSNVGQGAAGNYTQSAGTTGILTGGGVANVGPYFVTGDKNVQWVQTGSQAGTNAAGAQTNTITMGGIDGNLILGGDTQVAGQAFTVNAVTAQALGTNTTNCGEPVSAGEQQIGGGLVTVVNNSALAPGASTNTTLALGLAQHTAQASIGGGLLTSGMETNVGVFNVAGSMN